MIGWRRGHTCPDGLGQCIICPAAFLLRGTKPLGPRLPAVHIVQLDAPEEAMEHPPVQPVHNGWRQATWTRESQRLCSSVHVDGAQEGFAQLFLQRWVNGTSICWANKQRTVMDTDTLCRSRSGSRGLLPLLRRLCLLFFGGRCLLFLLLLFGLLHGRGRSCLIGWLASTFHLVFLGHGGVVLLCWPCMGLLLMCAWAPRVRDTSFLSL